MILILIAFICGFIMDVTWARCVSAVANRHPMMAANFSVAIYVCSLVSTIFIVEQNIYAIVSFVLGNWIGTYITVKWWTK